jgi:hypothetical protein
MPAAWGTWGKILFPTEHDLFPLADSVVPGSSFKRSTAQTRCMLVQQFNGSIVQEANHFFPNVLMKP